jgi:plasmid maintenance system antidote protein VapI
MLDIVDQILEDMQRTPAWLCRQAGVHRCNYTLIRKGERKLSENLKNKFSDILGIRKEILFNKKESK